MVGPVLSGPNNFQTNQRMLFIAVVINGVMIQEVVAHNFHGN